MPLDPELQCAVLDDNARVAKIVTLYVIASLGIAWGTSN